MCFACLPAGTMLKLTTSKTIRPFTGDHQLTIILHQGGALPKNKFFSILTTPDKCADREKGKLWERFASGTVNKEEDTLFRDHLSDCSCCAVLVANFKTTKEASEHYGIPPGPELDRYLTRVNLLPFPEKLRKTRKEFVKRAMSWRKDKPH